MKRTFIPPQYRPHVRGAEMNDGVEALVLKLQDRETRKRYVKQRFENRNEAEAMDFKDHELIHLFGEAFENLSLQNIEG